MDIMRRKIYSLFAFALMLTACHEDNLMHDASVTDRKMVFDVLGPGLQTKSDGSSFETGDIIGLYVTDYADGSVSMPLQISGNRANNLYVTFDGATWTPERTVWWGEGKSDVYAYYPYIDCIADVNSQLFSVATDQNVAGDGASLDAYEASDLLWAKTEGVMQADGAVSLQMRHIMSKLTVRIVAGEDYIGSLPNDASVLLHNTVADARLNLATGSVSKNPYSAAKSINMKKIGIKSFEGVDAVVYEAIVVPQMLESSVPLIEINSKSVSYMIEDAFNFRPGIAYIYTVTLNTSTTAIKVEIDCKLEDWNSPGDGSAEGDDSGNGESGDGGDDLSAYVDLSAEGTANCYLVQGAGDYRFKSVIGNSRATVGNVASVAVLWESFGTDELPNVGDLIAEASYKNGYICFTTSKNFRDGNAVIAAKNSNGTILWSWHIWCAEEGWQEHVYNNDAGTMMDRNLGATSATPGDIGALGLLYQWGRKDPFLSSSSISSGVNSLSTGIWMKDSSGSKVKFDMNPMTIYSSVPEDGWATSDSPKSVYDPCPTGWRIPDGGDNGIWVNGIKSNELDRNNHGYHVGISDSLTAWYPSACSRTDLNLSTPYNYYWTASSSTSNSAYANCLEVVATANMSKWSPNSAISKRQACSVRCVQE